MLGIRTQLSQNGLISSQGHVCLHLLTGCFTITRLHILGQALQPQASSNELMFLGSGYTQDPSTKSPIEIFILWW